MEESRLESKICTEVKKRGGLALKWTSSGFAGVPDRIVFFPQGRILFIEVKRKGGKQSVRQKLVQERLEDLGCTVWVVDEFQDFLRRLRDYGV